MDGDDSDDSVDTDNDDIDDDDDDNDDDALNPSATIRLDRVVLVDRTGGRDDDDTVELNDVDRCGLLIALKLDTGIDVLVIDDDRDIDRGVSTTIA